MWWTSCDDCCHVWQRRHVNFVHEWHTEKVFSLSLSYFPSCSYTNAQSLSLSLSLSLRRAEKYIHGMDKTVNWWETNSSFSTQNCSLSFPCSMLVYLIIVSSLLFTSIFLSLCPASFMAQRLHCISMFLSITLPISICPLLFFLFKILFIMSLQRCCSITLSWK